MGSFVAWLLHDDQKDLFEFLVALSLILLFLALTVPVLWPLGHLSLAVHLAKGYGILWLAIWITASVAGILQRLFRVNMYDRATAYVVGGLAFGAFLQMGWSAFAALAIHGAVAEATLWRSALLYLIGALSCVVAFFAVSTVYQGAIYKLVNLPLALVGFAVFSIWPVLGGALYGWLFRLF